MTYNTPHAPVKALFYDIETSPIICTSWSLFPEKLNHTDIVEDWRIICASWKWADSNDIQSVSWQSTNDRTLSPVLGKDDSRVIRKLHQILSLADVIVGHNSDNFDWKKFQSRCVKLGLSPVAPKATVDTLKVARKEFRFTSNRLDFIGEYLGVGGKMDTPKGMHSDVIWSRPGALKTMLEYNKRDVELVEAVYNKLKPYIRNHPALHHSVDHKDLHCPSCGSKSVVKRGTRLNKKNVVQPYQCKDCGSWMTGKVVARANLR